MDIAEIRLAIAARLRTIDGLEASHWVPEAINPPFAYPAASSGAYDQTLDGAATAVLTVRVLTSRGEDQSGQELLDGYLAETGATSIKETLEAEPTLGGLVDDLVVTGWDGYRTYEIAANDYYGAELTVELL